ncbi:amino acid adenylation domain-containing protein [Nannocystis exedens]|uniref:Amino acid adenylation domain-containing protein n=1 Tax=Nannocystis exedens TaxID=54 RepID=A0A1I2I5B1_9BACT|nr:amino acid adenylation domain-containing protein [Nannocystis exedens]
MPLAESVRAHLAGIERPASVVAAGWYGLVAALTDWHGPDIALALDGRDLSALRGALGPLAGFVPGPVALDPRLSFAALVERVDQALAAGRRWQHARAPDPADLRPRFAFLARRRVRAAAGDLTFELTAVDVDSERFELGLVCVDDGAELTLVADPEVLAPAPLGRLAEQYAALLASACLDPSAPLAELSLVDDAGRRELLVDFARGPASAPLDVVAAIRANAAAHPERVAVVDGDRRLTYGALERRSGALAARLHALGVGPESLVAIGLERSVEAVVAVVAALRAGAGYVPIDPEYPADRIAFMLRDAAPRVLVTAAERATTAPEGTVVLDVAAAIASPALAAVDVDVAPDGVAYVIYTSGSTGRPKGAVNLRRGVNNLVGWLQRTFALDGERDVVLHKTPLSFDVSVWELLWPLAVGARLVVARPGGHRDPAYLSALIGREGVTTVHFVPSMLRAFLDAGDPTACASLRRVLTGGEALPAPLARRFRQRLGAELHHLYGPSEAAVDATHGVCPTEPDRPVVSIGRPLAGVEAYVLDDRLRPLPVGLEGELYLGGVALARGYLRRPELTAERFLPHPFAARPGDRLYRTGDRACWLADGRLEIRGRSDFQRKIRGARVELGELEAALREHPGVREAAAFVDEPAPGDLRLAAVVVGAPAEALSGPALRRFLAARLPEFMLPASVTRVDALPLTPSGKLDRLRLPALGRAREAGGEPPRTAIEAVVAEVLGEVLGGPALARGDDFFARGGHSLLAVQANLRLGAAFARSLPLALLFEAPTVAGLAARIEAVLRDDPAPARPGLARVRQGGPLPLSPVQQHLWFLHRLHPDDPAWNMNALVRLRGRLDVGALTRALGELLRRHEILRTTYVEQDGAPVQVVGAPQPVALAHLDLASIAETEPDAAVARLAADEARRPFDLERGPLLRASLLRLADDDAVLALTLPHIVGDDWSMVVLLREVMALYDGAEALPGASFQYADFAAWQRDWLAGPAGQALRRYWKGQLAGVASQAPLLGPRLPPGSRRGRAATLRRRLPAALAERLRGLGRQEGATLFMTLLAGFFALAHRMTGATDLVIGSPFAVRDPIETESMIGPFVNMLPLRVALDDDASARDLLRRVRAVAVAAQVHQALPFDQIAALAREQAGPELSLLESAFVLHSVPRPALQLPGLTLEPIDAEHATAKYDVVLAAAEVDGELECNLEYDLDRTPAGAAEALFDHYLALLAGLVAAPDRPVFALPLADDEPRRRALAAWSVASVPYPGERDLFALFVERALRSPAAPAVDAADARLDYAALARRAERLAAHLQALGVRPGAHVGVALEPSAALIVAVLGVLAAGAVYVPLDVTGAPERLAFLIADAGLRHIVADETSAAALPPGAAAIVRLDRDAAAIAAGLPRVPVARGGDDLACIMYTSGSTGRPKGVEVTHRAILRLAFGQPALAFVAGDRFGMVATPTFDASTFELWCALLCGACVVPLDRLTRLDPPALAAWLRERRISVLFLTTALLQQLVSVVPDACAGLRVLLFGGQLCHPPMVRKLLDAGRPALLLHLYGPTECTVFATAAVLDDLPAGAASVPIGGPIAHTVAYVLDARLQPVPVGALGELHLAGPGLARGYLGRPELTAERFIPDPFAPTAGARMYRTGDVVRRLPDGGLDFVGRRDRQIKLRGQRIELGEIEVVLAEHPGVLAAAVVVASDGTQLVAHLVAGEPTPTHRELDAHLRARLPAAMVPSHFAWHTALPLTPHGKVDHAALAAHAGAPLTGDDPSARPGTPSEQLLAAIWSDILDVDGVGLHDDFFALGGHSLLATRVVSRIRSELAADLPLRAVFEAPTLAALARRVDAARGHAASAIALPLTPVDDPAPPLSLAQESMFAACEVLPSGPWFNVQVGMRVVGPLDVHALARGVEVLVDRHEALRTTFARQGGRPVQRVAAPAPGLAHLLDLSESPPDRRAADVTRAALFDARRPFDLAEGPLVRVTVVRLAAEEHVVLWTMHHIIGDGLSVDLLLRELGELYDAACHGRPAALPPLSLRYRDYCHWQRAWLAGDALAGQLDYWVTRLQGPRRALRFPGAAAEPELSLRTATAQRSLSGEQLATLRALGRTATATIFMTVLAALCHALSELTGERDICVGTLVGGRRPETEGLVGMFLNTLVLRLWTDPQADFLALVRAAREAVLAAHANAEVPFEAVVGALERRGPLDRRALLQVMLQLEPEFTPPLAAPGLRVEPFTVPDPGDVTVTLSDLVVGVRERADGLDLMLRYKPTSCPSSVAEGLLAAIADALSGQPGDAQRPSGRDLGARPRLAEAGR